ncbi:bifunctional 2-polyprenyl-6-hydroxyphenol methylase/3-demethylubiquinol 3-O-methyltransferase UbiG [Massilia sp. MS-15]|uniref:class I SAM-dependent methyltransferase n=1 Tax=Massilia sp. MS-15 TaxID=2878200 RepID=UPI001CD40FC6|nr:class I SAM-dependent methyltransferase [Massilia sp. MS-15]MCA1246984.1 class I SAM-dependent methyltransferase [Massilia sp. MS-15]
MVCIVCGNTQTAGIAAWHATCPACHYESAALSVAINKPTDVEINEAEREAALKALRLENFRAIVQYARRHARPGARSLLDVGSAHGWFLETAREDFAVLGIEPDAVVGSRAASRGLPVRAGFFPDVLQDDERFDVIVFNDVIEHIPDIRSALDACRQHLEQDGILILNLPSSRGFFYRFSKCMARLGWRMPFERLWQKDMPSPHVHYFSPANLATLVAGQGFELVDCAELPALRAKGLRERLSYAGKVSPLSLWLQYLAVMCAIPVLRIFPSDIIVCIFRKKTAG